jgi:hypothetical protein
VTKEDVPVPLQVMGVAYSNASGYWRKDAMVNTQRNPGVQDRSRIKAAPESITKNGE